ncbi:uncharacterized protein [Malus domestica]|uniref:uncharacterized protein isoform X2 n=1 Tax=Malus domestica TaxID=3750 RepID=UPI0039754FED
MWKSLLPLLNPLILVYSWTRSWTLDVLCFVHHVSACPHSQDNSKLFQLFRTNCSNIPALKHLRSLTQFKSTKGPVDTKRIYGTMVATKKGRAGRVGKLGNYNQMMNLRFTWANPAALSRSQFVLRRPCKGSHSARYT